MTWGFPFIFLLLPLPFLIRKALPPLTKDRQYALKIPAFLDIKKITGEAGRGGFRFFRPSAFLLSLSWLFLVAAAARPMYLAPIQAIESSGRTLMLAVDTSGSMDRKDFLWNSEEITRFKAVQTTADEFIQKRASDRLGLIVFGSRAFMQVPPTFDSAAVREFLKSGEVGMAGNSTAIGDAIGIAVKYLKDVPATSRVLVLLTDGASVIGISPKEGVDLAREIGLKIHTIGIGFFRDFEGGYRDEASDLDEPTLIMIAKETGGTYFRAQDTAGLEKAYRELDKLEPASNSRVFVHPLKDLFFFPLALSFLFLSLFVLREYAGRGRKDA